MDGFDQIESKFAKIIQIEGEQMDEEILQKAIDLRETGNYDKATDLLLHQIKQSPTDPNILSVLSHCYILNDNLGEAKIYLDAAKNTNTKIASIGWNETRLLLKQKKVNEALAVADTTNKLFPNDVEGMSVLGACLRVDGNFDESLKYLNQAVDLNPNYAEALVNRGLVRLAQNDKVNALSDLEKAHQLKPHIKEIWDFIIGLIVETKNYPKAISFLIKMIEVDPGHDKSFALLAICNQEADDLSLAIMSFEKVFEIRPDDAFNCFNLGMALQRQGKTEKAIEYINKAISIKPDFAEAYINLGNALKELGKLEQSVEAYKEAIATKPDYAEAYNNMGNALRELGKLKEAIEAYKKALSIKPNYAEAYNNIGVTSQNQGNLNEAIEAYKKALSIMPDYAEAHNNTGLAFQHQGKLDEAIEAYKKALAIKPNAAEAYDNMANALTRVRFTEPDKDLQKTIISILDRKTYARPSDIASAAISLLKFEPTLQKHLKLGDDDKIVSPLDVISDLCELPLLLKLMSVCPLPDLEVEGLLKNLRCAILSNILSLKEVSAELIGFQSALALQCFTNEYIYNPSEEEEKILQSLEASVIKDLKNKDQPSPQVILALASYKALNKYDWCNLLVVTDDIHEVFSRQVNEPDHELKLKKQFPILEEITDSISSKVRAQYEESPYPRWVNLRLSLKPLSISNVVDEIKLKLHDTKITEVEEPEILVAGCGTGQDSIGTATRFKSSKILAFDLSLSSLAYAKRKTEELAIENIEYMQADILDLGKLNKQFDIIESAGVLHHMDNPMAGWKVLVDCLKPGGLMKIGLYSKVARQHIVKIKDEISETGIGSNNPEMKSFRDIISKSDKEHHELITNSADFYSLSTLKDLLFHVQEHKFTISQIKNCLDELGLKFCGFETQKILLNFQKTNKKNSDAYDLDKWKTYEEANPKAFTGMYQFWCQKVD